MKKNIVWLVELCIWVLVITIIVVTLGFFNVLKLNKKNTYHIFIHDINGLKKGSPVKIMGVGIGYITEINVIDDYMYISFMVSKKDVTIPHGSLAKVESYGLAGSKSIELYPPTEKADKTKPVLLVEEPIRSGYGSSISKSIIIMSEGTSAMLNKKTTAQHQKNIKDLEMLTESIDLNKFDKTADETVKKMKENKIKREKSEVENE